MMYTLYVHIGVRKWLFRNVTYDCGIWDMGLLYTAVCKPVFNREYFGMIYSLKFKMTQNQNKGSNVKN